ncbi:hypothetical protein K504DRAFT_450317 [Pleomassaria siparia CBS 279.74]|uniref:Uncharacterized protein n=1 Tax=Pleomassaria siparia CBS 279.74 TaxID=1314801 RepID=A0A6G1KM82_9PLEO|nr:hypothetical protein K504DRAFT_450317 [Pleomassaria siparia CBS 279.74]
MTLVQPLAYGWSEFAVRRKMAVQCSATQGSANLIPTSWQTTSHIEGTSPRCRSLLARVMDSAKWLRVDRVRPSMVYYFDRLHMYSPWSTVHGLRSMVYGPWFDGSMVLSPWSMVPWLMLGPWSTMVDARCLWVSPGRILPSAQCPVPSAQCPPSPAWRRGEATCYRA